MQKRVIELKKEDFEEVVENFKNWLLSQKFKIRGEEKVENGILLKIKTKLWTMVSYRVNVEFYKVEL
ncbi:hypothetical protein [Haliovirga abyssi]|uniref:Uncharacterized protein n=1 Tax=Haliovirga abyssi TaxID=2996794 RepID=A0AAU9DYU0_9FUSO|nr:hypothetical protein [Haliovirga abyssi]BDU50615.1 hypothetical protein HLVA_11840 [Haliovirga abyssi]